MKMTEDNSYMQIALFGCGNVGFETVKALHKDSFVEKIHIFNRSYPQYLKESLENSSLDSTKIDFFQVNSEDEKQVETAFSATIKGKIDVLICTTGVFSTVPATQDFNKFRSVFDTNIFSNLIPIKVALNKNLFNANARIVVLSSLGAHHAPKGLDAYYPSKWGLENLCSSLRAELKSREIRVDIVCPCAIRNQYSKVFNFSSGLEASEIAGVIEKILKKASINNKFPGKNYFIPFNEFLRHVEERIFPSHLDKRVGLMSTSRRRENYRKIELNSGLITGAASGLGKELAILYCKRLKNLFLLDNDKEGLEKIKAIIESMSDCSVQNIHLDLNKLDEVAIVADKLPAIDLLINCAGVYVSGLLYDTSIDICQRTFNINFFSSVLLISKLLNKPNLPKKIINIISISAIAGQKGGLYPSTKAALWCFTRSLRRTYGNQIQIIEALPGAFTSNLAKNAIKVESNKMVPQTLSFTKRILSFLRKRILFFLEKHETSASVAKAIFVKEKKGEEIIFIPKKIRSLCIFEAIFPLTYGKLRISF